MIRFHTIDVDQGENGVIMERRGSDLNIYAPASASRVCPIVDCGRAA
jgi:hypothetical protein